jgi:cytochrome P450
VLTRYEDVTAVLRDYDRFTNVGRIAMFLDQLPEGVRAEIRPLYENFTVGMPNNDPPEHTRIRGLVSKAFTPRVVDGMRPRVQAIVDDLLGAVERAGEMDAVCDFAYPLPVIVIAETLGVPSEDRDQFKKWSDDIVAFHGTGRPNVDTVKRSLQGLLEAKAWLSGLIAECRQYPKGDLLSGLVAVEERGDMLNETELLSTCITLIAAGHETTTGLIGNGLLALLLHPDQMQKLRDDPTLITTAVKEFLRYDTSFQRAWRLTAEDAEIGGKLIPKGQTVSLMLGAANRDPARFSDPDRLDITRTPNRHVAFGQSVHACLGAPLARREGEIACTTLLRRFPKLRLAESTGTIAWQPNNTFHNLKSLSGTFA